MMNLLEYPDMFYASHYLPIALYEGDKFIKSAGFYNSDDPYPFVYHKLKEMKSPGVYTSSDTGYFGIVDCADGIHSLVFGPAYSTPVTDDFIRAYMNKNAIPKDQFNEIATFLGGITQYTYNKFLNLLVYQHFIFSGEKKSIIEAFGIADTDIQELIGQHHSENIYVAREESRPHGTYPFEQQMLNIIKNGEVETLQRFLFASANMPNTDVEGKLAESPLRQAKNIFIGLVTVIGKFAAIPGGMDVEETYQLIDVYIQECERLQTVEAVKNLQTNMPMDFVKRIAQSKLPEGVSKEIYTCMQYISTHINEPITAEDVVAFSGKSRAYLFKRFKDELGMGIGAYIAECRLREAKSLLRYTNKPISEISNYLCFSSQSHFQNAFKQKFAITPHAYRQNANDLFGR